MLKSTGQKNFYIDPASGIYYTKKMVRGTVVERSTGLKDEKKAFRRHIEILRELNDGRLGWNEPELMTFGEWWLEYRQTAVKAESTWDTQEGQMGYWLGVLGKTRLTDLKPAMLQRHINKRRALVADTTVSVEQDLVKAVLNAAVRNGLIPKNPGDGLEKIAKAVREAVLGLTEQDRLLALAPAHVARFITFLLGSGLRISEVLGIVPSRDIDWAGQTVLVTRKGGKQQRVPLLDPLLLEVLAEELEEHRTNVIFPCTAQCWGQRLDRAVKEAKVAHVHPHMLRHTFATRYLQSGGDIYVLSKILGHKSVKTTEKVYAHLLSPDLAKLSRHVDLGLAPRLAKVLPFTGGGRTGGSDL